jgi:PAS domain S-box-containing protein
MPNAASAPGRADLLLQSVSDYAIYMLDPAGIVTSWNAGARRLKGYAPEEVIGRHFSRFYEAADRAAGLPERALATALAEGRFEAEGWRLRKDGSRFWANVVIDPIRDEAGRLVGFAKVTRDLSERREAEEALRRSEERFRLLVQNVTDYAIYMLDPDGVVTSWNAGAERFKGYRAEEIIGQHFSRFYRPEDRAAGVPERALATALADGRFEAEGWRLRKDGSAFWASVVIDPIRNPAGQLIGFTKITRDLTERREAQLALEAAQQQFYQSQKFEAVGKLTGGVAHDFNNILAAIMGSLDLARRRAAQGQDISRFLDNAMQAAGRGATLTQRMLAFARRQELKLEPVDLLACMEDMADLLERTIGAGITIGTRFPPSLPPVLADRPQLELAILNLVVNARDAMPQGGRITISAEEMAAQEGTGPERAAQADAPPGRFVLLAVADEGEGMDGETLERAAEPFFTTKGVGKGTGLGLSMVQGTVEQCGGRLRLASSPGEGTRVELLLPVAAAPVPVSDPAPAAPPPALARPLRILAVDDDPVVLLNTATLLADAGHEVAQARCAGSALRQLAQRPVDLLITDFAMPGMTGGELAGQVRRDYPGVKVIVVTGYAELPEGGRLDAPRLAKPFSEGDLAAMIARVMDGGAGTGAAA